MGWNTCENGFVLLMDSCENGFVRINLPVMGFVVGLWVNCHMSVHLSHYVMLDAIRDFGFNVVTLERVVN